MFDTVKRVLVGRPLRSSRLGETLLPKRVALPVFCSDPISSVAYATEQIVLVLAAGGLAALRATPWVGLVVVLLLVTVVASYRQTCYAYPSGGGAYVVSKENLGESASLAAAAALLVDYVMTVAVSVTSGVVAVTSALPALSPHAVSIAVGLVVVLTLANLRGTRESGRVFAVPTYAFVGLTLLMFVWATVKALTTGGLPAAVTATQPIPQTTGLAGLALTLLLVRAFASGCTALTGVEAISNGVPSFEKPKARNAAITLTLMGVIAVVLFGGITVLAVALDARAQPDGDPSVISQIAGSVFGGSSPVFYLFQAATAAILVLAANTAFNGFPVLASILARDRYLPRQLHNRGDRLVFSNGVVLLAAAAIALVIGFEANIDRLIQLYIIGVFTSFTLSQLGMVRHWQRALRGRGDAHSSGAAVSAGLGGGERRGMRRSQAINATGAVFTAVVLVVVFATKVTHGAWIAVVAMVVLFAVMRGVNRYYDRVTAEVTTDENDDTQATLPSRVRAIVLVSRLHKPATRALALAWAIRPDTLTAITLNLDEGDTRRLRADWETRAIPVPLTVIEAPYRDLVRPLVAYVRQLREANPQTVVMVFIPEYVVTRWWQQLLHNQSALRLKARLLFTPGVVVVDVPYHLGVGDQGWLGTRRPSPTPDAAPTEPTVGAADPDLSVPRSRT